MLFRLAMIDDAVPATIGAASETGLASTTRCELLTVETDSIPREKVLRVPLHELSRPTFESHHPHRNETDGARALNWNN